MAGKRGQTKPRGHISVRRCQLGEKPLQALFERLVRPIATPQTRGAFRCGLRLVAVDSTLDNVADTPANHKKPLATTALEKRAAPFRKSAVCTWLSVVRTSSLMCCSRRVGEVRKHKPPRSLRAR